MWAGIATAFFFLLRASEYLVQTERSWGPERAMKGFDLEGRRGNVTLAGFSGAEELVLHIRGSKTDQYNVGTVRNQYASGEAICVVAAWQAYEEQYPERIRGSEKHLPLMRYSDGSYVDRASIQHYLELAAAATGGDAERMGSHSLRIGGATALYHVVQDLQVVRRFGRWESDAFHLYLWESHEPMRGLAAKMATDETELVAPKEA